MWPSVIPMLQTHPSGVARICWANYWWESVIRLKNNQWKMLKISSYWTLIYKLLCYHVVIQIKFCLLSTVVLGPKFKLLVYYVYKKRRLVFRSVIYSSSYYYHTSIFLFQSNVRVNFKMKRCQKVYFASYGLLFSIIKLHFANYFISDIDWINCGVVAAIYIASQTALGV